ncbi:MAG: M48 family metallopeptidase [Candidatus Gastranaerophilales bacterium]|nr:M48 family metallopeptidase [Candidatus Gastranaerophilales bacterium]
MKKIAIILCVMLLNFALATDWDSESALKRVNTIGTKILKANNINHQIEFKVSEEDTINAYANIDKEVYVYKGLLEYVDTDDELAGVISHEMGHIINGHCAKQGVLNSVIATIASIFKPITTAGSVTNAVGQQLAASKISRNDEFEADLTGVDLMSKGGYNPLGMVSLLSKISQSYIDILQSHPSGEKRIQNAYDYINYNYPSYISKGYSTTSYQNALNMMKSTLSARQSSTALMNKYETAQKKLLAKKQKREKKMQGTSTVWDGYYQTLLYTSGN